MDITSLFKAKLELAKNRSKALGDSSGSPKLKTKILPSKKSKYYSGARELVVTVTKLKNYLNDNRASYLQIGALQASTDDSMTEQDRDEMDLNVHKILLNCQGRIPVMQALVEGDSITLNSQPQLRTHLDNVMNSIRDYIKEVSSLYSEMRAIRVKRTINMQNISKLYSSTSSNKRSGEGSTPFPKKKPNKSALDGETTGSSSKSPSVVPTYLDEEEEELSPEEIQKLEQENNELLNQLHSLADEVDQIQSNVVNIAQLQSIFSEKVLEQDIDIENIANSVVTATENVKGGNEQIRQAIQQNADFRAWILFFIIVMSLSLLFLDWYND